MNSWIPVIVAVVGSLGGAVLTSLLLIRRQAKKLDADTDLTEAQAADTLAGVAVKLVEPLTKRLAEAEARASALDVALRAATVELADLRTQLGQLTKELDATRAENEQLRTPPRRGSR